MTQEEVLVRVTELGLRTRRGQAVTPQSFGGMLENRLYITIIDVPGYSVSSAGEDFAPANR